MCVSVCVAVDVSCTDLRLYTHEGVSAECVSVFRIGEKVVKQSRQRGHCLLRESESQPCGREIDRGRGLLLSVSHSQLVRGLFLRGLSVFHTIFFTNIKETKNQDPNEDLERHCPQLLR